MWLVGCSEIKAKQFIFDCSIKRQWKSSWYHFVCKCSHRFPSRNQSNCNSPDWFHLSFKYILTIHIILLVSHCETSHADATNRLRRFPPYYGVGFRASGVNNVFRPIDIIRLKCVFWWFRFMHISPSLFHFRNGASKYWWELFGEIIVLWEDVQFVLFPFHFGKWSIWVPKILLNIWNN